MLIKRLVRLSNSNSTHIQSASLWVGMMWCGLVILSNIWNLKSKLRTVSRFRCSQNHFQHVDVLVFSSPGNQIKPSIPKWSPSRNEVLCYLIVLRWANFHFVFVNIFLTSDLLLRQRWEDHSLLWRELKRKIVIRETDLEKNVFVVK